MNFLNRNFMLLDQRLFKAFMAAAKTQSFTSAATKAHLTQSGVSQHIAKLEDQLGAALFKRIGKKVILTDAGSALVAYIQDQLQSTQEFIDQINIMESRLTGLVSYAMPPSCIFSPHFPMLLERRLQHPGVQLNITLTSSQEVVHMILADQIDFGFVTHVNNHVLLNYQLFCQEEYILISNDAEQLKHLNESNITQQDYILYTGCNHYYDSWLKHAFPKSATLNTSSLSFSGKINSINGAIDMVEGGLGIAVIPRHCVSKHLEEGRLFYYQAIPPLLNDIHIITLKDNRHSQRVAHVIQWFFDMNE